MKFLHVTLLVVLVFLQITQPAIAKRLDVIISSEAAILLDAKSGAVLYEKNATKPMFPASLTKIATAIYAIEYGSLDEIVTVGTNAVKVDGTRVYLEEGEKVTLKKLIQGMLINSGNDAAIAIAEHLHGDVYAFSKNLNKYLQNNIGVTHTNFTNPHGLFEKEHITTAYDIATIINYAIKNPEFLTIFGTKNLPWDGQSWDTTLITHHRLLKGEIPFPAQIIGGKTGYVDQSKQTLATVANNGNINLTAIVLKNESKTNIYNDTVKLFQFGFDHFQSEKLSAPIEYRAHQKEYILLDDTFVTEAINGSQYIVDEKGNLVIKDKSGNFIQSIALEKIQEDQDVVSPSGKAPKEEIPFGLLLGGILVITFTSVFVLKKKTRLFS